MVRLRQAVIAAGDLDAVSGTLRSQLGLGAPFADPAVAHFGLRNAVFALGDSFLEVVSPVREGTAAGRLLSRRGGDCGYMLMFQVDDLDAARRRAVAHDVREVFAVDLQDMVEVHLHPGDMRGAIVSMSAPQPPSSWRWGGPEWQSRTAPLALDGATVAVAGAAAVRARWSEVIGGLDAVQIVEDRTEPGVVEIVLRRSAVAAAGRPDVPVTARPDVPVTARSDVPVTARSGGPVTTPPAPPARPGSAAGAPPHGTALRFGHVSVRVDKPDPEEP